MFQQLSVAVIRAIPIKKRKKTSNDLAILVGDREGRPLIHVTKTPRNARGSKLCNLTKHNKYIYIYIYAQDNNFNKKSPNLLLMCFTHSKEPYQKNSHFLRKINLLSEIPHPPWYNLRQGLYISGL